jgi:hypothetical protein
VSRPSPLDHTYGGKDIILGVSQLFSICMRAWIDRVSTLIVQLDVVVGPGFAIALGKLLIRLRRGELYVFV